MISPTNIFKLKNCFKAVFNVLTYPVDYFIVVKLGLIRHLAKRVYMRSGRCLSI